MASAEFYSMLISKSVSVFGAKNNDDFPEILIDSVPVPDFISETKHLPRATSMLMDRIDRMNAFGVSEICIACNTAHLLLPKLRRISKAPIVSIVEEVGSLIVRKRFTNIGLLATPVTYKSKLYGNIGNGYRRLVIPSDTEQEIVESCIRAVIAGEKLDKIRKRIRPFTQSFIKKHRLDAVILGCTELPLIFPRGLRVEIIDTLDILANAVLAHYYGRNI